ncbi:MAG: hypothetical protein ACI9WC_001522, partial [Arenicella sp.]
GIDHYNMIACINVGGEFSFVFASQAMRDFSRYTTKHFIGGVYDEPLARYLCWLCGKCFHILYLLYLCSPELN